MYLSDEAMRAIHQERLSNMLEHAEHRRLVKQVVTATNRRGRTWKLPLGAALSLLRVTRAKPALEAAPGVEHQRRAIPQ